MKNLKAKLRRDGGFTLVEMLIVVAIIAILIAISIPMVGSALEKARQATDAANVRAAIAEASIKYLTDGTDVTLTEYDAATGSLKTASEAYGQTTTTNGQTIWVQVTSGVVKWAWNTKGTAPDASKLSEGQPVKIS